MDDARQCTPWRCIMGWHQAENFYTVAVYYANAGHQLFGAFEHDRYPGQEFPWLFCWRHAFELLLKAVLDRHKHSASQFERVLNTCGHGLRSLYEEASKAVPGLCDQRVDEIVTFLDKTDPDAMSLRYPHSKKGTDLLNQTGFYPEKKQNEFQEAWQAVDPHGCSLREGVFRSAKRGS